MSEQLTFRFGGAFQRTSVDSDALWVFTFIGIGATVEQ